MATQPKVGSLAGLVLQKHVAQADASELTMLMLISEAEGEAPAGGDIKVPEFAGLLLESQISRTPVSFFGALMLIADQERVILDAPGNLLNQTQY